MDAVLPNGTTVHVVGLDDLRNLKQAAGTPRDLERLQEMARAKLYAMSKAT
jgi:predicted nucleotidyltransferase